MLFKYRFLSHIFYGWKSQLDVFTFWKHNHAKDYGSIFDAKNTLSTQLIPLKILFAKAIFGQRWLQLMISASITVAKLYELHMNSTYQMVITIFVYSAKTRSYVMANSEWKFLIFSLSRISQNLLPIKPGYEIGQIIPEL